MTDEKPSDLDRWATERAKQIRERAGQQGQAKDRDRRERQHRKLTAKGKNARLRGK